MQFEAIKFGIEEGIATITLNRPDSLNAFNTQMGLDFVNALDITDADDDVRAVIVTGAGRAFCAGADLSSGDETWNYDEKDESSDEVWEGGKHRDGGGRLTLRIFNSLKPIIAAINGPAVGLGITMTLPMDIRIASDTAKFGFVFARRGIVPDACASYFLPRIVGISKALQWCYNGKVYPAQEALKGGLVESLHPPDELLEAARSIAREIVENTSAVSNALTRHMMWRMLDASHPMEAHRVDSEGVAVLGKSADAQEGIDSFLEKRPPKFPGRVSKNMPDFFPWWEDPTFS